MNKVIFSIGTNLGNRIRNLIVCIKELEKLPFVIEKVSSVYKTKSLLKDEQPDYFNIVVLGKAVYDICDIFKKIKSIEQKMGRVKTGKWQARVIDIDIIDYNNEIIKNNYLTVPHKEMIRRSFVLYPLKEIYPDYIHPEYLKGVDFFILNLEDNLEIKKVGRLKWE